jgi:D-serine dehydratase
MAPKDRVGRMLSQLKGGSRKMDDNKLSDLLIEMLREECSRCEKLALHGSAGHQVGFIVLNKLLEDMKQVQRKSRRYA